LLLFFFCDNELDQDNNFPNIICSFPT